MGLKNWTKNLTKALAALTMLYNLVKAILSVLNGSNNGEPPKNGKP